MKSGMIRGLVAAVLALPALAGRGEELVERSIGESLTKIVKLYGAGGYRGLDAYGTGCLISPDGEIVTSWGPMLDADPVTAVLDDGRRFQARLAGADPGSGLALLRLETEESSLPFFDLAEAAEVGPGDRVLALSNMFRVAAGDEPVSVMHGTILAEAPLTVRRGRFDVPLDVPMYVLDAVTNNPGAAGGAIVTLDGRLAGLIGRELRADETSTWVNYAVPGRVVAERMTILRGEAKPETSPSEVPKRDVRPIALGLVLVPDVTVRTPAYVTDVVEGSPAEEAGIRHDDLIVFLNGSPIRSIRELSAALSATAAGDDVTLVLRRGGRLETVQLRAP